MAELPTARACVAAATLGGRLYVLGGKDSWGKEMTGVRCPQHEHHVVAWPGMVVAPTWEHCDACRRQYTATCNRSNACLFVGTDRLKHPSVCCCRCTRVTCPAMPSPLMRYGPWQPPGTPSGPRRLPAESTLSATGGWRTSRRRPSSLTLVGEGGSAGHHSKAHVARTSVCCATHCDAKIHAKTLGRVLAPLQQQDGQPTYKAHEHTTYVHNCCFATPGCAGSMAWWSTTPLPQAPRHHAVVSWPGPCGEPGASSGPMGDHSPVVFSSGGYVSLPGVGLTCR